MGFVVIILYQRNATLTAPSTSGLLSQHRDHIRQITTNAFTGSGFLTEHRRVILKIYPSQSSTVTPQHKTTTV